MKSRVFSTQVVGAALRALSIAFVQQGPDLEGLAFASLRHVQAAGIYFVEGAPEPAGAIRDSLVLCRAADGFDVSNTLLVVAEPQLAFYKLMRHFYAAPPAVASEIHPTAIIDPRAVIGAGVTIGPYSVIGDCVIERGTCIGPHVVVEDGSTIGEDCEIASHTTIGAAGVAWIWDPETRERIVQPQIGGCIIEARCFIGTNVTVVRGSVNESTLIGEGTLLAHGTKIGHGCNVGKQNHFANSVSLAGNVTTGDRCFFGSGCIVRPMIRLTMDIIVGAGAVVVNDVDVPHSLLVGVPAVIKPRDKSRHNGVPKNLSE